METESVKNYSIKDLRAICQKTAPNPAAESYVGRFCRIFSIYTTKILLYTKISPNQITTLSVLVFFLGIFFFFSISYYLNLLACLLIFLSIVLDGSDGEVARFRKSQSYVGGVYTEPVSHDIQYGFSFLLLGLAFYLKTGLNIYLFLGGLTSILKLEFRMLKDHFTQLLNLTINKEQDLATNKNQQPSQNIFVNLLAWFNKNFLSSTGFLLTMLFFSLSNKIEWSLIFYSFNFLIFYLALFLKQIYIINKNIF